MKILDSLVLCLFKSPSKLNHCPAKSVYILLENNVAPGQLASEDASWPAATSFTMHNVTHTIS